MKPGYNTNYYNMNQPHYQQMPGPVVAQPPPIQMMPYQPVQPVPVQPVVVPVVTGAAVPLLVNQNTANISLQASECFEDLHESSEAMLTKYFEGLIFKDTKYEVTIKYRNGGSERNIFIGKKTSSSILDKDSFKISVKYIPRDSNYNEFIKDKKFDQGFFEVSTIMDLLKGCAKPNVQVLNTDNNTVFGNIRQPNICCCSDPDYQIKNSLNFVKYRVVTEGCKCSYCCCEGCCCLFSETSYKILDSTHTQIVGEIFKYEYVQGGKEMLTYRIIFPNDATPEEKILIISTAMAIDHFVYKSIGGKKK